MSHKPINKSKIDRRQWLKASVTMLGTTLLPMPGQASEIVRADSGSEAPAIDPVNADSVSHFLNPAEYSMVVELSETIIPADSHSGGAKVAKVADYIEQVLRECNDEPRRTDWREGLRLVDLMSWHSCGKAFLDSDSEQRIAVLTVLSNNNNMTELPEVRMFRDLRELTILGYYTTKIGIHDELDYKGNCYLQEFVGCDDQGTT